MITGLRLNLQCVLCANYAQSPWSLLLIYGHQGEYNFTRNLIPAAGYTADLQPARNMKEHLHAVIAECSSQEKCTDVRRAYKHFCFLFLLLSLF